MLWHNPSSAWSELRPTLSALAYDDDPDGDLASNSHGWQWTAGTGTGAAPYFRVFNPTGQAMQFDPDGDYVRHWIPEPAHLPGESVHEPWEHPAG